MKILIIGAEGQVGGFLMRELVSRHQVWGTSMAGVDGLPALDMRDAGATLAYIERLRPDHVVLTAAMTHVDRCEEKPDEAEAINVRGTENVARACRSVGAGMTFFSSDYIFDGHDGPYAEDARPNPLSVYGRNKLEGERIVSTLVERHLIVRTMVVYSYLAGSLNLFMQILERVKKGEPITQPGDQWVNPTQAANLAQSLGELIEDGRTGIYNLCGTTRLTRDEFARRIVARLGGDPAGVRGVATDELKQKAPRPLASGLKTDKALGVLKQHPLWDLETALEFSCSQMRGEAHAKRG